MIIITTQNIKLCPIVFLSISGKIIIFDIKTYQTMYIILYIKFPKILKKNITSHLIVNEQRKSINDKTSHFQIYNSKHSKSLMSFTCSYRIYFHVEKRFHGKYLTILFWCIGTAKANTGFLGNMIKKKLVMINKKPTIFIFCVSYPPEVRSLYRPKARSHGAAGRARHRPPRFSRGARGRRTSSCLPPLPLWA